MRDAVMAGSELTSSTARRLPRLGFLGLGWIGQNRMEAIARSGSAEVAVICDASHDAAQCSLALAPGARAAHCFEEMLNAAIDGVVIATPSAMHAEQSVQALNRGLAVFCQKPLGRTQPETLGVVEAACAADRLLGVDFCYRFTSAMRAVRSTVRSGALGEIYAVNLVFHNAYGPDKPWFYDRSLSGGGCVIDLGIHLVDAVLWTLDFPPVIDVNSRLYAQGRRVHAGDNSVEDFATAHLDLDTGVVVDLACSWKLSAGQDCVIKAEFYGTRGGTAFRNVNGSFYDFVAERYEGTQTFTLASPPDDWSGRAALEWTQRLACQERFNLDNRQLVQVAEVIDAIYAG